MKIIFSRNILIFFILPLQINNIHVHSICTEIDQCLNDIKNNNKLVVATSKNHVNLLLSETDIFCFPNSNNIHNASIGFLIQHNYHLLSHINYAIQNSLEFGLINKWKMTYHQNNARDKNKIMSSNVTVLKINHLFLGMLAIAIGWILGGGALFFERWLYYFVQQENPKWYFVFLEMLINDDRYVGGFLPELPFFSFK